MTVSYPRNTRQVREALNTTATKQVRAPSPEASNVRSASASLLTNRVDNLSFRMGRLFCAGLE